MPAGSSRAPVRSTSVDCGPGTTAGTDFGSGGGLVRGAQWCPGDAHRQRHGRIQERSSTTVERSATVSPEDTGASLEADAIPGRLDLVRSPDRGVFTDERAEADLQHLHVVHGLALVRTGHRRSCADRWSAALPQPRRSRRPAGRGPGGVGLARPIDTSGRLSLLPPRPPRRRCDRVLALLMAGRANLVDQDLTTWINWAPWVLRRQRGRGPVSWRRALPPRRSDRRIYQCGRSDPRRPFDRPCRQRRRPGIVLRRGTGFVRQIRNGARRLDAAGEPPRWRKVGCSPQRERSQPAIAPRRRLADTRDRRERALRRSHRGQDAGAREAKRLEDELAGTMAPEGTLVEAISSLVREHGRFGLHIDLSVDGATEPALASGERCRRQLMRRSPMFANMPVSPRRR